MVETITPVVHGGSRRRWAVSVAVHAVGATLAAAGFGALLGAAGGALRAPWGGAGALLVAAVAALYVAREGLGLPVPVPEGRRQVPDWWRTFYGPTVSAFLYGLGLGVGFFTYLQFGTLVAVGAGALATGSPSWGAAVMAPFGLARGLTVIVGRDALDEPRAGAVVDALARIALRRWPRLVNVAAMLGVAAVATVAALGSGGAEPGGVAAGLIAIAFGWSAAAKVHRPSVWRRALEGHRLPRALAAVALVAVPIAEAGVVGLALVGAPRLAGAAALALLAAFSAAILRARSLADGDAPCGCFGSISVQDAGTVLARNALLAVAAGVALVGAPGGRLPRFPGPPSRADLLPIALVALGLVVTAWAVRSATNTMGGREP